jgi:hypothetical protein
MPNRKQQTVHAFVERQLKTTRKPYAEIAKNARREFKSETSPASVRHYASKMRRDGVKLKDRPVVREAMFA